MSLALVKQVIGTSKASMPLHVVSTSKAGTLVLGKQASTLVPGVVALKATTAVRYWCMRPYAASV
jgi:hypothetical protein